MKFLVARGERDTGSRFSGGLPVLVGLLVLASCAPEPTLPPRDPVVTWRQAGSWSGRGNQQLETLPIQGGPMRLHWETKNAASPGQGHLKVRLQSGDSGRVLAEPIDVRGAATGTADVVVEHHRIYLTIESADVDWAIRIEEAIARQR